MGNDLGVQGFRTRVYYRMDREIETGEKKGRKNFFFRGVGSKER